LRRRAATAIHVMTPARTTAASSTHSQMAVSDPLAGAGELTPDCGAVAGVLTAAEVAGGVVTSADVGADADGDGAADG